MTYKTSFNGLEISVKGVYKAYNLTEKEVDNLKLRFSNMINGSNGNYTIYQNANRKVLLNLFVHDVWIPISFDIRSDLLKLFNSNKIYERDIKKLSKILQDRRISIHATYDYRTNSWDFDKDNFLKIVKDIITSEDF